MNTKLTYLYRDGSNYKIFNEVVVEDKLTEQEIEEIFEQCDEDCGDYLFIPRQVGLPEKRFDTEGYEYNIDDHGWFELLDIEITDEKATAGLSARELWRNFAKVEEWDDTLWLNDLSENEREKVAI